MKIKYRDLKSYKYQLVFDYEIDILKELNIDIGPFNVLIEGGGKKFIELKPNGKLKVFDGYSWDGPSGPTFDTKNFMRGSLVHDALYQLIREQKINSNRRALFDEVLYTICIQDGMWPLRAKIDWLGLKWFGAAAAKPKGQEPQEIIYEAP